MTQCCHCSSPFFAAAALLRVCHARPVDALRRTRESLRQPWDLRCCIENGSRQVTSDPAAVQNSGRAALIFAGQCILCTSWSPIVSPPVAPSLCLPRSLPSGRWTPASACSTTAARRPTGGTMAPTAHPAWQVSGKSAFAKQNHDCWGMHESCGGSTGWVAAHYSTPPTSAPLAAPAHASGCA